MRKQYKISEIQKELEGKDGLPLLLFLPKLSEEDLHHLHNAIKDAKLYSQSNRKVSE